MQIKILIVDDEPLARARLRTLLGVVAAERKTISTEYGLVSAQSIGAIQRLIASRIRSLAGKASRFATSFSSWYTSASTTSVRRPG